jgi:putative phage-type endonuclease
MNPEQRKEWLRERKSYLGGTDLSDIALSQLGLRGMRTPYQVWQEKVGEVEPQDLSGEDRIDFGTRIEPLLRQWFSDKTGKQVVTVPEPIAHPHYPFIRANIDGRVVDESAGLECKNVDRFAALDTKKWGDGGDDRVPPRHFLQCMSYLACTSFEKWYLCALIGGNSARIFHILPDPQIIERIVTIGVAFWTQNVLKKIPPAAVDIEDARRKFPKSYESFLEADAHTLERLERFRELKAQAKVLAEETDTVQGEIADYLGPHEWLTRDGEELLSWKTQQNKGYTVQPYESRVMRLKAAKKA